ncbi:MAG: dTDP-glucose 4,6-dehydratase [Patescibacteria group bacterium]
MKILVTGGAGFMGSAFIRHILKSRPDDLVVNLDKLTYAGNLDNLKEVANNSRYQFVKGDIVDEKIINDIVSDQVDVIVNYAAETHVDRSILNPRDFIMTDIVGTYNLLEAAKKYKISRYIQISTDEVFGSTETRFIEESKFDPSSPYSASKAGADLLCQAYTKTYQMPIVVTHSCNNYGPYHYPEKLIPLAVTNLLENKSVPIYSDGLQVREWIYVDDHARAIDLLVHKDDVDTVYNIGTGEEFTNLELINIVLKLLNKDESCLEFVKDRPAHDRRYALDSSRLRDFGFKPQVKLGEGLSETVMWYKENKWWWEKIKLGEYLEYYKKQYYKR